MRVKEVVDFVAAARKRIDVSMDMLRGTASGEQDAPHSGYPSANARTAAFG
jgi:hypothetical protein